MDPLTKGQSDCCRTVPTPDEGRTGSGAREVTDEQVFSVNDIVYLMMDDSSVSMVGKVKAIKDRKYVVEGASGEEYCVTREHLTLIDCDEDIAKIPAVAEDFERLAETLPKRLVISSNRVSINASSTRPRQPRPPRRQECNSSTNEGHRQMVHIPRSGTGRGQQLV